MKKILYGMFLLINGLLHAVYTPQEASAIIDQLYQGKNSGYLIRPQETKKIEAVGGNTTYGELLVGGLAKVFDEIHPSYKDVFVNLGSGAGRTVIFAYLATPVSKSIGIELSDTRYNLATQALNALKEQNKITSDRKIMFEHKSFIDVDLSGATIVLMNSLFYSDEFVQNILDKLDKETKEATLITTKKLVEDERFELKHELIVPVSWNAKGAPVYIYRAKAKEEQKN